jgi:polyhydroxybutyrate depolymerase
MRRKLQNKTKVCSALGLAVLALTVTARPLTCSAQGLVNDGNAGQQEQGQAAATASKKQAKKSNKKPAKANTADPFAYDGSAPIDNSLVLDRVVSEGIERDFYIHVPQGYNRDNYVPVVIVYHGGFEVAARMDAITGFDGVSDRNGFLLVYPEALNKHWNDGRNVDGHDKYNDVQFTLDMIKHLERRWNIDPKRVYVCGLSNGGFFTQYLAMTIGDKIAACASVGATLPQIVVSTRRPVQPISMLYILGMADPLMPFGGGYLHYKTFRDRGGVLSAQQAAQFWVRANSCNPEPRTLDLPDYDPNDGTRVKYAQFSGGRQGSEVVVYGIEGGGHTWPGGTQFLSEKLVGKVCRDVNASELIWDFFRNHAQP